VWHCRFCSDGEGVYEDESAHVFLGHKRLAIVDLAGGYQPMPNEDHTIFVIFNGEIYNHATLRQELMRRLDRHPDAAVTSLIPALSCRSCRPNVPFAELARLSRTSIADEMREEHRRRMLGRRTSALKSDSEIDLRNDAQAGCTRGAVSDKLSAWTS